MNIHVGRQLITISHPDKILIPNITKLDIVHYYLNIAPFMLPYLKNRPLMMQRFPEGIGQEFFYQKDTPDYFPDWIKTVQVPKKDGFTNFSVCQHTETLIYLVNQACLTFHCWLSKMPALNRPDRIIFDLDPSDNDFNKVRFLALALHELLNELTLESLVMTTGSRGLHIHVPIARRYTFEQTRAISQSIAKILISQHPHLATMELRKEKRSTKVFVDTLRNHLGATAVAPFSLRPIEKAPVAAPLFWHEVENDSLHPQQYTINCIFDRVHDDPWAKHPSPQTLNKALQTLKKLGL